jgi:hypothetical protein
MTYRSYFLDLTLLWNPQDALVPYYLFQGGDGVNPWPEYATDFFGADDSSDFECACLCAFLLLLPCDFFLM